MKTFCCVLCACLAVTFATRAIAPVGADPVIDPAVEDPAVTQGHNVRQDPHIVRAMKRIEARLQNFCTDDDDISAEYEGNLSAVPAGRPIIQRSPGKKTIRIMSQDVNVKAIKVLANAVWKQKLSLKLRF